MEPREVVDSLENKIFYSDQNSPFKEFLISKNTETRDTIIYNVINKLDETCTIMVGYRI